MKGIHNLARKVPDDETNLAAHGLLRGFLNFLKPMMSVGLLLIKNVFILLAKIILVPLGLTAPASTTYAAIQK